MAGALTITGSYKGSTGHDHHTRSIVRALHQRGTEIELRDLPEWSPAKLPADQQDSWFDRLNKPLKARAHLHFCMPHQVRTTAGILNVNYTMFEADRIPSLWVQQSEHHDLIVVPVESCRRAWIESGVPGEKVVVCPLGVDATRFAPSVAPLLLPPLKKKDSLSGWSRALLSLFGERPAPRLHEFSYRFLNISDANGRKNLTGLLKVWLTATRKDDDAVLILKMSFSQPGSRCQFDRAMKNLERRAGKSFSQAAPIFLLSECLSPEDMPSLYTAATHYISLSFGEGFDLPMVEAGVSGLQLIAPRHSAYLDYLNDEIAHLLTSRPVPARLPDDPLTEKLFAGASWWEPDQDVARKLVMDIIDGRVTAKASARAKLSQLSWSQTAECLLRILDDLEQRA